MHEAARLRCLGPTGPGPIEAFAPSYRIRGDVRSFQVVPDQAPEGRQRRQARRGLHQDRARDRASPRAPVAAPTPTPTTGCAWRIEKARAVNMPADNIKRAIDKARRRRRGRAVSRRSSTRATAPAAWPSSSRRRPTTATGPPPTCAPSSPRPAASWPAPAPWPGSSSRAASSRVDARRQRPDEVALLAIDAGAIGRGHRGRPHRGRRPTPGELESVRRDLEAAGVAIESAELDDAGQVTRSRSTPPMRARTCASSSTLEDHDDVQRVTANFEIPDEILAEAGRRGVDRPGHRPRDRDDRLWPRRADRQPAARRRLRLPRDRPTGMPLPERLLHHPRRPHRPHRDAPAGPGRRRAAVLQQERADRLRRGPGAGRGRCWPPRSTGCRSTSTARTRSRWR